MSAECDIENFDLDLIEDFLFGFRIRTPGLPDHGSCDSSGDPDAQLASIADCVAEELAKDGTCLELTGGVDSRFLLSLALWRGVRPRTAFTIGVRADDDVQIAAQLAEQIGIKHCVLPISLDINRLESDVRQFVSSSGFRSNASSYGWLPAIFRKLSGIRDAQVSGVGGELGGGFYYSPWDFYLDRTKPYRLWCRARLIRPSAAVASLYGHSWRSVVTLALERSVSILRAYPGDWRDAVDLFYREQRLGNWAVPVLKASADWYRPVAPLMSMKYWQWTRCVPSAHRFNRRLQCREIERRTPEFTKIPFDGEIGRTRRGKYVASMSRRVLSRFHAGRSTSDSGAVITAHALVERTRLPLLVNDYAAAIRLDRSAVNAIFQQPDDCAHEIGALVTNALAWESNRQC